VSETQLPAGRQPTRRAVLLAGAGGAGVAVVAAACSSGSGGAGNGAVRQPRRDTPLAKVADVKVGSAVEATLPSGAPVIVARPSAQQVVCFSAICTHEGCVVQPSGTTLNCPCHGSRFDALTGKVLQGPAARPLPKIAVAVRGGEVVTT
jgi:Rieske Fe-S protein